MTSPLRDTTGLERTELFEQPITRFDIRWQDQLGDLLKHDLHVCKVVAKVVVDQPEMEANQTRNALDAAQMPKLDKNEQVYLWNASNRKETLSPLTAQEREDKADMLFDKASKVVQERYANLQEMLRSSVKELLNGRELNLSPFLAQQVEFKQQQENILAQPRIP